MRIIKPTIDARLCPRDFRENFSGLRMAPDIGYIILHAPVEAAGPRGFARRDTPGKLRGGAGVGTGRRNTVNVNGKYNNGLHFFFFPILFFFL